MASLASVLFFALYETYVWLGDWMHRYTPPTDPVRVNRWLRAWVGEYDGIESFVMLATVTAFLLAGYAVAREFTRIPWFRWWPLQLACAVPGAVVIARIHSSNFTSLGKPLANLKVFALGLGVVAFGYLACRVTARRPWLGRGVLALGLVALAAFVVLSANPPATFDYGFFVAPARKLAQGEPLGSFYIQYNLIGTYLFRLMIAFGFRLHEMQAVLGVLFAVWVGLYYLLAKRLFDDRFMVFLFVAALLVVRLLAIMGGPSSHPQVSTLRMDLWVLLALVLARYGFASRVTSVAFALGYVADNVFGFLFFAFYIAALAATLFSEWKAGRRATLSQLAGLGAPLGAALLFQLWTFGALTSPAGKVYQDVHLGFLEISLQSMFWGVAWLLLAAQGSIAGDPNAQRRGVSLFLFAFAASQLLYFYGRSHDHNLLNLSGIWLLILFLGLDRLRHRGFPGWVGAVAGALFVCLAGVAVATTALPKLELAEWRISRGVLIEPAELDREIDNYPDPFAAYRAESKLFLFAREEAYLNYRYGLPQIGYFAPFYASVFTEPTAHFVRGLLLDGYRVLMMRTDVRDLLDLNNTEEMRSARQQFVLLPKGIVLEVVLTGPNASP